MKIIIISLVIFSFFFLPINADNQSEANSQEDRGVIASIIDNIKLFFEMVVNRIISIKDLIIEEIKNRQEVVEEEIEKRKDSFAGQIKTKINDSVNLIIDSLVELIKRSFSGSQGVDG